MIKSDENIQTRFDILDGFRGILAITIVFQHTRHDLGLGGDYGLISDLGYFFAVPSFFALSSFLLTNKLYTEFIESNGSFESIKQIIVKYLIRRFLRIYVPFVIYCTYIKTKFSNLDKYPRYKFSTWYDMVTLKHTGINHLWTIPPEVKFYLLIPIFSFVAYKLKKYFIIWASLVSLLFGFIEIFNIYGLECVKIGHPHGENLELIFQIFLAGSLVGILFYEIQNCKIKLKFLNKFRFLISYINPISFIYGLKLSNAFYRPKIFCYISYGVYWSIYILILLLDVQTCFTEVINLSIFKKFGKYSFGVYLLHVQGFRLVHYLIEEKFIRRLDFMILFLEIFISFIFGMFFYYFIENPLMKCANILCKKVFNSNNVKIITYVILSVYVALIFFFMLRKYFN
jgi:peptidoglycan/LPS O-acetylase OafA/YrhL